MYKHLITTIYYDFLLDKYFHSIKESSYWYDACDIVGEGLATGLVGDTLRKKILYDLAKKIKFFSRYDNDDANKIKENLIKTFEIVNEKD